MAHGFTHIDSHPVPGLRLELHRWQHSSGAIHLHLASDDEHRAFAVAFRTLPTDDTGLSHILEHTVLCGSKRFPVRDPFFMMLRRSLQTFMNAFTYPDMTCYPFATQVAKDFDNLLAVYLDAVFAPALWPLDFAQEGWRLEPSGQADEDWQLTGVVYNEMKGAMADADAQMSQALTASLLGETCYRFNSGGDPAAIPDLSHADLVAFHRERYGAANACFATYGRLDEAALHARFAAYCTAQPGRPVAPPDLQPPLTRPQQLDVPLPLEKGQDPRDVCCAALAWAWGDSGLIDESLEAELVDQALLGHPAAPLRLALEASGLGRSIASSGYLGYHRNGCFLVELKGLEPSRRKEFEALVLDSLRQLAETGLSADDTEAALHQLELRRRHIGGDGMPFGLQLCLRSIQAWNHEGDPRTALDQDESLARLRSRAAEPDFWPDTLRRRFLDNPHRVLLLGRPEVEFHARARRAEQERLNSLLTGLTSTARDSMRAQAQALADRQGAPADLSCLPDLSLDDVPRSRRWAEGRRINAGIDTFIQGTNGILHCCAACALPRLDDQDLALLPLFCSLIGQLGVGDRDYRAQASLQNARCGRLGLQMSITCTTPTIGPDAARGLLIAEIRGLRDRADQLLPLLVEGLCATRFDEHERLRELLAEELADLQENLLDHGHQQAMRAAMRGLGGLAGLAHEQHGLGRLEALRRIDVQAQAIGAHAALDDCCQRMLALRDRLAQQALHLALIGDDADASVLIDLVRSSFAERNLRDLGPEDLLPLGLPEPTPLPPTAYTTASPVSYLAMACNVVPLAHPDAAALSVATRVLKHGFLHGRIRERGGAYGALCSYAAGTGTFCLASYRDPRFIETLADMHAGIDWLASHKHDDDSLREAILATMGGIDHPASPAGEARRRFLADRIGHGPAFVAGHRERVLALTPADLRRVASTHLCPANWAKAAITSSDTLQRVRPEGWHSQRI